MTSYFRNDFRTFRETLPPLLSANYRIWPRWQREHFDYLLQLASEAVARANCGVEERLRASWDEHDATFALYLRSFAHESLTTGSPRGQALSFDLSGIETALAVSDQLGDDATVVLLENPVGLAFARSAVPADDRLLAIAADHTWTETVNRLIERADLVVLAVNVMGGGVETERTLLREAQAEARTVILLAEPPTELTMAYHRSLHQAPFAVPGPQVTRDQFTDFPWVVDGWDARDDTANADLARTLRRVLGGRRGVPAGEVPVLPPVEVDKSIEAQGRLDITLASREAAAGRTKRAILLFTSAVYCGYEACSIPVMLDACAQLAHWSTKLGDPGASDYRQLHGLFAAGVRGGFAVMDGLFQQWLSTGRPLDG